MFTGFLRDTYGEDYGFGKWAFAGLEWLKELTVFFGRASSSQFQSQVTVRWNRVTIDKGRQRVLMIRGTCYNNGSNSRTTFLAVWANSDT